MDTKKLTIRVIVVLVLAVICGLLLVIVGKKECKTKNCKKLATQIKDFVSEKYDPCNDFYNFACGKMLSSDIINLTLLEKNIDRVTHKIDDFFDDVVINSKPNVYYTAKRVYDQCLDIDFLTESKIKTYLYMFMELTEHFPLQNEGDIENVTANHWTLPALIGTYRNNGINTNAFFTLTFKRNPHDTNKFIMSITIPDPYFITNPQYLASCEESCQSILITFYTRLLTAAGVKPEFVMKQATSLLAIDIQIANLTYLLIPPLPHVYKSNTMTVKEFMSTYEIPNFDWNEYFNSMFGYESNSTFSIEKLIVVEHPEYLHQIKSVIANLTVWQQLNYLGWYSLRQLLMYPGLVTDESYCVNVFLTRRMPEVMTALAAKFGEQSNRDMAKDIIKHIRSEVKKGIEKLPWMDSESRTVAVNKLNNLDVIIGNLDLIQDSDLLDEYYKGTENIVGKNFYFSVLNIMKFNVKMERNCFKKSFDDKLCTLMLTAELDMVGLFYDPVGNVLVVNDPFLREPLFMEKWPKFVYYSRLGFVVGHELINVFNSIGSHYDIGGKLKNWWTSKTLTMYQVIAKNLLNQIGQFQFDDGDDRKPVPAERYLNESINDNGGLTMSFTSYKNNKGIFSDLELPGVDYTDDQLFFITLSQLFCKQYTEMERAAAYYDVRGPRPVRVDEMLQNSPDFIKAFNCAPGTEMNSPNKYTIFAP